MTPDPITALRVAIQLKRKQLAVATLNNHPDRKKIKNELLALVDLYTEQGELRK